MEVGKLSCTHKLAVGACQYQSLACCYTAKPLNQRSRMTISQKARLMKQSPQQAINQKCKDCIYDEHNGGTWRDQTEACTVTSCALYDLRPVSSSTKKQRSEDRFNALSQSEKLIEIEKRNAAKERLANHKAKK